MCIAGNGRWVCENITDHDPRVSKLDVCWLKTVVCFIILEIGITKALYGSLGGSKCVFNNEVASHTNQSARGGFDVEEVFL